MPQHKGSCSSIGRKQCFTEKAKETYQLSISAVAVPPWEGSYASIERQGRLISCRYLLYLYLTEKDKVCHRVLQCKAVRRNAVQCAAVAMRQWDRRGVLPFVAACRSAVQCSAMCRCRCYSMKRMQYSCSVVHCVWCIVVQCSSVCCTVWQCVAVFCSLLQYQVLAAVWRSV